MIFFFRTDINHLFFADDAFLFVRNKKDNAETVKDILVAFEGASRNKIKYSRYMIYFSPNTSSN